MTSSKSECGIPDEISLSSELNKALNCDVVDAARQCVKQVLEFDPQKTDRNQFAELQVSIDKSIFGLTKDRRKSAFTPSEKYKITVLLTDVLAFEVEDDAQRDSIFNFIFLSAKKDTPSYKERILFLAAACTLAVQCPNPKLLECTAKWLFQGDSTESEGETIIQAVLDGFTFVDERWGLSRFVEELRVTCMPFMAACIVFSVTDANFGKSKTAVSLIKVLSKWFLHKSTAFVEIIKKSTRIAADFGLFRLPIILKYCCNNGIDDEDHERFHVGSLKLLNALVEQALFVNVSYLLSIDPNNLSPISLNRVQEWTYLAVKFNLVGKDQLHPDLNIVLNC
uniref:Uncharacterized protein n=1 Tax=Panagrolaimus sp. JU765 TaxID=591449 RepID=A0AC34RJK0_9BILA